ncbi:hypothetical protein FRB94_003568 [Tulasnella sp. JGI-2019a]|nr:hypothetical protein FRB93_002601 [Tulasnella sp. JGI-2019a]KAG9013128.1 hypothetical protein FRB94_003568 [Tulasnella sp. JGI-2019a]KAG9025687.1 hypothetical protein FRB95_009904 [Tulasnella sp. JGI-2019a]
MSTPIPLEANPPPELKAVRGLVFDLIGTCTNWHSAVSTCLKAHAQRSNDPRIRSKSSQDWDHFAHLWRSAFFKLVAKLADKDEMMDMSKVYQETLRMVMKETEIDEGDWDEKIQQDLLRSWQVVDAWGDTAAGLQLLRQKFIVIGLSNGALTTTIAVNKHNGLHYDALLSSDMIGTYKPNKKMYESAINLLKATDNPGELAMVAAHAYDTDAAAKHGMKTIYIKRVTEDMDTDLSKHKFDLMIDEGGLVELARRLGCKV